MYKAVFQNSKIALFFAVMTIISAVSMVGTSEDTGVVGRAAGLAKAAGDNARQSGAAQNGSAPSGGAAGIKGALPSVFGDYASSQSGAETSQPISPEDLAAGNTIEPIK